MFGGLCFLVNGHMACGITGEDLMVPIGAWVDRTATFAGSLPPK